MRATARALVPLLVAAALAACGDEDGRTAPASDADRSRQRFAQLADSLDRAGSRQEADVARAVAELVRLSGRVSTLDVAFDGRSERFTAVALQVSAPPPECPQGAGCPSASELSVDLVLAWQGDGPSRVLLFAADTTGPLPLGPPRPAFADSVIVGECYGDDGFCEDSLAPFGDDWILAWHFAIGAMAEPADERLWVPSGGSYESVSAGEREACPASTLIPAGVSYQCTRTDVRVAFDAEYYRWVDERDWINGTPPEHSLAAAAQPVAGVRIRLTGTAGGEGVARLRRALRGTPELAL
jgi:hypothetical protein